MTAVHLNGSLIGPTTLYPGYSTPAQAGRDHPPVCQWFRTHLHRRRRRIERAIGVAAPLPTVTVGGLPATVQFAGLISPGLYQFNVVLPASLPSGDNSLTATYNGLSTQPGVLISIH